MFKVCLAIVLVTYVMATDPSEVKKICLAYAPNSVQMIECVDTRENHYFSKCLSEALAPAPTMTINDYVRKACEPIDVPVATKLNECTSKYEKAHPSFENNLKECREMAFGSTG